MNTGIFISWHWPYLVYFTHLTTPTNTTCSTNKTTGALSVCLCLSVSVSESVCLSVCLSVQLWGLQAYLKSSLFFNKHNHHKAINSTCLIRELSVLVLIAFTCQKMTCIVWRWVRLECWLTLTMLWANLVTQTYNTTFANVGIFWCYGEIY